MALTDAGGPIISRITSGFTIDRSGSWGLQYGPASPCPTEQPPLPITFSCDIGHYDSWDNGYIMPNITITNEGDRTSSNWDATIRFSHDPQLSHAWNADVREVGYGLDVDPESWQQQIAPGESISFGFMGNHDGEFELPTCSVRAR